MVRAVFLATLVTLAGSPPSAAQDAQMPTTRLVPIAGTLTDASGARAAARTVTFALFDEQAGGTLLWTEAQTVSVDARGRYSAHLGAVTPLPLEIFRTEQARWLEVSVDGKAQPRVMLVAVPYALRAADAETLGGTPASDFVRTDAGGRRVRADGTTVDHPLVDGTGVPNQLAKWNDPATLSSSIVTESFDNRIGILAPDPTGGGVVDARFTIRHLDNNTALGVLNTANQRRFALNTLASGGWTLFDGANGIWNLGLSQENGRVGVGGVSVARFGVFAMASSDAVFATAAGGDAVLASSSSGTGVAGFSGSGIGVTGSSFNNTGVSGLSTSGTGVRGQSTSGLAGQFVGNVTVSGTLTKGGGAFEIDHPLDPDNKYLRHSFVESPDMMNVYNGNVTLDAKGEAWVALPEWFAALNRDFRYQLTPIGAPGPNLHIGSKISGNRFRIAGGAAGAEVSWQVTGIRQDAWANAHRIVVEEDKPGKDRGFYLHPDAFGQSADLAVPARRTGVTKRQE